jgi:putative peptide zinc metalloprotease protein
MKKSLYSSNWYRVEQAKPRLRSHAAIYRHQFRGELWYVLQDRTSGRFLRFTPAAYYVMSLMDGERTVQEIWDMACVRLGDDVLTQDELISMLAQLHQSDVLQCADLPDLSEVSERTRREGRRKKLLSFINPLAIRIPLFDPDRFLTATLPLVRPLISWVGALIFLALIVSAAVLAGFNWSGLTNNIADRVLRVDSILLLLLTYPFVKAVHELGHGYVPVPYVDASDSAAMRDKWQRALVGAAGIIVELVLASLAMLVWINAEEGLARALAFNVMLIGGVSTLLFNGNPLLKFDGYYVLSDVLEIPNLFMRGNRYLGYLIQRHLFGMEQIETPITGPGEARWLVFYSIASFLYRLFIMTAIVSMVATKFFFIGVVLAIWAATLMLGLPLFKHIRFLLFSPALRRNRRRAVGATTGIIAAVLGFLMLVPLPYSTITEGIVWTPDEATIYARSNGVITGLAAQPNAEVTPGTELMYLEDSFLDAHVKVQEAQVRELELRYESSDMVDPAEARIVRERLQHAEADLDLARQRQRDLVVRSTTAGRYLFTRERYWVTSAIKMMPLFVLLYSRTRPTRYAPDYGAWNSNIPNT